MRRRAEPERRYDVTPAASGPAPHSHARLIGQRHQQRGDRRRRLSPRAKPAAAATATATATAATEETGRRTAWTPNAVPAAVATTAATATATATATTTATATANTAAATRAALGGGSPKAMLPAGHSQRRPRARDLHPGTIPQLWRQGSRFPRRTTTRGGASFGRGLRPQGSRVLGTLMARQRVRCSGNFVRCGTPAGCLPSTTAVSWTRTWPTAGGPASSGGL
mmetsp:Transcript_18076/g.68289  ORF Transcript_18076/g.68289 Transcript_18076/m.68289 type:complete len:224 (-) Transcript_18076:722-1393(-)